MELEELIEVVQKLSAQVAELRLENANLNAELNKSRVTRVRSSASKGVNIIKICAINFLALCVLILILFLVPRAIENETSLTTGMIYLGVLEAVWANQVYYQMVAKAEADIAWQEAVRSGAIAPDEGQQGKTDERAPLLG